MIKWLKALYLPWDLLPGRWAMARAIVTIMQRVVDAAHLAAGEWSPLSARPRGLTTWGRVLGLPRRPGESLEAHRGRCARWRSEPVGTSGWVRDEVERITGQPRVIEFPRDGLRCGHSRCGHARVGQGPNLVIGAADEHRAEVEAMVDRGIPPDAGVRVHDPTVFDAI